MYQTWRQDLTSAGLNFGRRQEPGVRVLTSSAKSWILPRHIRRSSSGDVMRPGDYSVSPPCQQILCGGGPRTLLQVDPGRSVKAWRADTAHCTLKSGCEAARDTAKGRGIRC